jgi:hypothetical protein
MSGHQHDLTGTPVSEEHVASELGFSSVHELRRWQTEQGTKVVELEYELTVARGDADRFKWVGERMLAVLTRLEALLKHGQVDEETRRKALLAIAVVSGRGVDWNHEVTDWFISPG